MYEIRLYRRHELLATFFPQDRDEALDVLTQIVRKEAGLHTLHVFLATGMEERDPEDFRSPLRLAEVMNEDPGFSDFEVVVTRQR